MVRRLLHLLRPPSPAQGHPRQARRRGHGSRPHAAAGRRIPPGPTLLTPPHRCRRRGYLPSRKYACSGVRAPGLLVWGHARQKPGLTAMRVLRWPVEWILSVVGLLLFWLITRPPRKPRLD